MSRFTRPDGTSYEAESNDATLVWGIDADGVPLGLVPPEQAFLNVGHAAPAGPHWRWSFADARYVEQLPVSILRDRAYAVIDAHAGAARMRYITETPGQQAVYLRKREQAIALLADPQSTPGAYLVAEANATGSTPAAVAQLIATIAGQWDDALSPAIEGQRLGGKRAVELAQDEAAITAAVAAAVAALDAI
jgi:hypothetical protein